MSARTPEQMILLIKSLDPQAHVAFSEYTGRWYVSAHIEISDGAILSGISEHAPTVEAALRLYVGRLVAVDTHDTDHVIVSRYPERRHWRWNGFAFTETPMVEAQQ